MTTAKTRILVVDDEDMVRNSRPELVHVLRRNGGVRLNSPIFAMSP